MNNAYAAVIKINPFIMSSSVEFKTQAKLHRPEEGLTMRVYHEQTEKGLKEHVAIIKGDVSKNINNVIRVHSSCITSEVFGCTRCDCSEQLEFAFRQIDKSEAGAIIYLDQEGRDIGLANKVQAYHFQDLGFDTLDANLLTCVKVDARTYMPAVHILNDLGITSTALITNNPNKVTELAESGIHITSRIPVRIPGKESYLSKKEQLLNHVTTFDKERDTNIQKGKTSGFDPIN